MKTASPAILKRAHADTDRFASNPYVGRTVGAGVDESGEHLVLITLLEGTDKKTSKNRRYKKDNGSGRVFTEIVDKEAIGVLPTHNIIYNAMLEDRSDASRQIFIGTNGHHSDDFQKGLSIDRALSDIMRTGRHNMYEDDSPNYTSRVGCVINLDVTGIYRIRLTLNRREAPDDPSCRRVITQIEDVPAGLGYFLHTYMPHDERPIPPFSGEPPCLLLPGDGAAEIAYNFWMLRADRKVGVAVKLIAINGHGPSVTRVLNHYGDEVTKLPE